MRRSLWGFWPLSISWIHVLLRRKQEESAFVCLGLQLQAKTQVLELLTDAYLNISEDEAYTQRRGGRPSGENMWKTFGSQTERCDLYNTG